MRTLTSLLGNSQRLDGGSMFGNAPKALWTRWCEADELNRISLACRCLLVREQGRNILFETGVGAFFSPKMRERFGVQESKHVLLESLAGEGLSASDIDIIVLSHLHFDHAGGLLEPYHPNKEARLAFPSATILIGSEAWERAKNPHPRDRASFIEPLMKLLSASGNVELISGTHNKRLGTGYSFISSSGHSPGMLLSEIAMPSGNVVFMADLVPGTPWVHLPITMGYDRFAEQLIDEKHEILEELVTKKARLFYTHDANVALSGIEKNEKGRFQAIDCQTSIRDLVD